MVNRRGFLQAIGAALAGTVIDPDLALWVPGRKLISIPKPVSFNGVLNIHGFNVGDIITITGVMKFNPYLRRHHRILLIS